MCVWGGANTNSVGCLSCVRAASAFGIYLNAGLVKWEMEREKEVY